MTSCRCRFDLKAIGAALALVAGSAPVPAAPSGEAGASSAFPLSAWSERGMFVFGSLSFDFLYGTYHAPLIHGEIEDCSNGQYFCIKSKPFNLALPRSCEIIARAKRGDVWSLGSVRNKVLHIQKDPLPPLHGGGSGTTIYIGNSDAPDLLYEYDPAYGVTTIHWDQGRARFNTAVDVDLTALARRGEIMAWAERAGTDPTRRSKPYSRVTQDPFGKCGRATPISQIKRSSTTRRKDDR